MFSGYLILTESQFTSRTENEFLPPAKRRVPGLEEGLIA